MLNNKNIIIIEVISCFLFFIITGIINQGCSQDHGKSKGIKDVTEIDTVAVQVADVSLRDLKLEKTFTGTLEGEEQANIVSKIPERITKINVRVGDEIQQGQVVILLDKSGASSQYFQAKAGFQNAEKDLARMKSLYKEGAISQQLLDGTQTSYEIAKANYEAAKSSVELTSPINGIITAINLNVGDLAQPGMVLITVASINKMKILFDVGELDIPNFAIGQNADIFSDLNPEIKRKGKISQISKSANIQSRSFELKAIFTNTKNKWFKPGMFCKINVELVKRKNAITVPSSSIISNGSSNSVYIINDRHAHLKNIKLGISNGNFTEIIGGLKGNEKVVTLGMNSLREGSIVHISNL